MGVEPTRRQFHRLLRHPLSRQGHHIRSINSPMRIILPLEQILVEHSTYLNLRSLKDRLLRAGLLHYHCYICGLTKWLGERISLQLDHINGIPDDNRLLNLRLLCPNCHSQTETYGAKRLKQHHFCPDCSTEVSRPHNRCSSCAMKHRHLRGDFQIGMGGGTRTPAAAFWRRAD